MAFRVWAICAFNVMAFLDLRAADAQMTVPDTLYVSTGGRANVDALANDVFDGVGRVVSVTQGQSSDRVLINTDGTIHYRPIASFEGRDEFSYELEAQSVHETGQVIVFVVPWDEILDTEPDSLSVLSGQGTIIDVLENDRYLGARVLTIRGLNSTHILADIFVSADLKIYYRLGPNFLGEDRFVYVVEDDLGQQRSEWVVVDVVGRRLPSVAVDDFYTLQNTDSLAIAILANDTLNSEVEQITFLPPMMGQSVWDADAQVLHYVPQKDVVGIEQFAYRAVLDNEYAVAAQIRVEIIPFNAAPQLETNLVEIAVGQGIVTDVLANAQDAEGDVLKVLGVTAQANQAQLFLNPDGSVFYRSSMLGGDLLTYEVSDGVNPPVTGHIQVIVTEDTEAPFARDDTVYVDEEKRVNVSVLFNDSYTGDTIGVSSVTAGQFSDLVIANSDHTVHYRAGEDFDGRDFFTYTIRDRQGREASALVRVLTAGSVVGDFDGNAEVGFSDFLIFVGGFGSAVGDRNFDLRMDLDGDGKVGFSDFLVFVAAFNK